MITCTLPSSSSPLILLAAQRPCTWALGDHGQFWRRPERGTGAKGLVARGDVAVKLVHAGQLDTSWPLLDQALGTGNNLGRSWIGDLGRG